MGGAPISASGWSAMVTTSLSTQDSPATCRSKTPSVAQCRRRLQALLSFPPCELVGFTKSHPTLVFPQNNLARGWAGGWAGLGFGLGGVLGLGDRFREQAVAGLGWVGAGEGGSWGWAGGRLGVGELWGVGWGVGLGGERGFGGWPGTWHLNFIKSLKSLKSIWAAN